MNNNSINMYVYIIVCNLNNQFQFLGPKNGMSFLIISIINQLLFLYETASLVLFKLYKKEPPMQMYGAYTMDSEAIANGTSDNGGAIDME